MKNSIFIVVLLLACSNITESDTRVSGLYCLDQFYYNFVYYPTNNTYTLLSSNKIEGSKVCIDVVQYSDTNGFFHLEGYYRILWRGSNGDTLTIAIINEGTSEDGLYNSADGFYHFNSRITWVYHAIHRHRNGLFEGNFGVHTAESAETLAVVWKK